MLFGVPEYWGDSDCLLNESVCVTICPMFPESETPADEGDGCEFDSLAITVIIRHKAMINFIFVFYCTNMIQSKVMFPLLQHSTF